MRQPASAFSERPRRCSPAGRARQRCNCWKWGLGRPAWRSSILGHPRALFSRRWTHWLDHFRSWSLRLRQLRTCVIVHGGARGAGGNAPSCSRAPVGARWRKPAVRPSCRGWDVCWDEPSCCFRDSDGEDVEARETVEHSGAAADGELLKQARQAQVQEAKGRYGPPTKRRSGWSRKRSTSS